MEQTDLLRKLRAVTDCHDATAIGRLLRPPFLKCAPQRWGLLARDLPGGVDVIPEALEHVEAVLSRRQRGLASRQVRVEIAQLSKAHAEWTAEMCLSVLRADSRFRLSLSGNVGLAEWESVRVPSRVEIVRQCMDQGAGRVTVEAIQDRISAIYGSAPDRVTVGQIANRFGGRLEGDVVVGRADLGN